MTDRNHHLESVQNRSNGFLFDLRLLDLDPSARAVVGRFDRYRYRTDLFEALGLRFPDHLNRAVDKRRGDFLAGRALAASALASLGSTVLEIATAEDRAPIWPSGFSGSISHTHGLCVAVVLPDPNRLVGIDIEKPTSGQALDSILKVTMSEQDRSVLAEHTPLPDGIAATVAFSAKETLFKALFPTVRNFFGFECAELAAMPRDGRVSLRLTDTLHPLLPSGTQFDVSYSVADDHVLTWLILPALEG